jgi:AraC family transcriptional activator of pobA
MLASVGALGRWLNAHNRPCLVFLEHSVSVLTRSLPAAAKAVAAPLPAYQLYGERQQPQGAEPWHVETIWARSRLHDWEIRPHQHEGFQQFLHMSTGRAELWLDGQDAPLIGPCVVLVPPMTAHGFRFQPGVQGHVITVQAQHVQALLAGLGAPATLSQALTQPAQLSLQRLGTAARALQNCVQNLAQEYADHAAWRAQALDAALLQLLVLLARALPAASPSAQAAASSRAADHLERYRALVASRFRLQPKVSDLAAELGLTATQLNRVCQATLGQSALALLHARMLLEAQRQLAYTTQSVKRIGMELGFADPAYFSRFFQRLSGQSPQAWRDSSQNRATTHQASTEAA